MLIYLPVYVNEKTGYFLFVWAMSAFSVQYILKIIGKSVLPLTTHQVRIVGHLDDDENLETITKLRLLDLANC